MKKLTMESTFKKGKYANKSVADLVKISGKIFSMIKEGYDFDDEVLQAAHIKKTISDVKIHWSLREKNGDITPSDLPNDTASVKQILSEINTLDKFGKNLIDINGDELTSIDYENELDVTNFDKFEDYEYA